MEGSASSTWTTTSPFWQDVPREYLKIYKQHPIRRQRARHPARARTTTARSTQELNLKNDKNIGEKPEDGGDLHILFEITINLLQNF